MKNIIIGLTFLFCPTLAYLQVGDFEWALNFGGTTGSELVNEISIDNADNSIVTGYYNGSLDLDPGPEEVIYPSEGIEDTFIQKLDATGDFVWGFTIQNDGINRGTGVVTDDVGNIYVSGIFDQTVDFDPSLETNNLTAVGGNYDCYLMKLDPNGNLIWVKSIGGTGNEFISKMHLDNEGNLICVGGFSLTTDFNPGIEVEERTTSSFIESDIFILKLTGEGEFIWVNTMGSPGLDEALSLAIAADNTIAIVGRFVGTVDFDASPEINTQTSNGSVDIFVLKLDSDGDYIWSRSFGGEGFDDGNAIAFDLAGNIFITGSFMNTVSFNTEIPSDFSMSDGVSAVYILKLNADGAFEWVVTEGGDDVNFGTDLLITSNNRIIVSGVFSGEMNVGDEPETITLISNGNLDAFCQIFTNDGSLLKSFNWGAAGDDGAIDMEFDAVENVVFTGVFQDTVDFNPFEEEYELFANGEGDIYITKYSGFLSLNEITALNSLQVYPNPASQFVTIVNPNDSSKTLELFTITGKRIRIENLTPGKNQLSILDLDSGIYLLKLGDQISRLVKA